MNEHDESCGELPTWQLAIFSVVISGHLLAVLAMILAVPSGPWPTADGTSLSTPPQFAYSLNTLIPRSYLQSLGMAQHDHHVSDDPARRGVFLELRLEDANGHPLTTFTLPNPECNWWIRHRQSLLVRGLADDIPIAPPEGEMISAPGQSASTTPIWEVSSNGGLELRDVAEHLIPRERPVFGPSEKSLLLARSMARYLCRTQGAARVEIIRHTQEAIPPAIMFLSDPPADESAGTLVSNFGKFAE
ncbi:MAG TPA: hypothetical protein PLR25_13445 [Planctomycetaceae bacterium]|nr:hypothetical protein [Planctomycetaceae bacterium]